MLLVAVLTLAGLGEAARSEGKTTIGARLPDGKLFVVADGQSIRFFDAATQKEVRRIQGHQGNVTAIAFAPDGKVLATGGQDKTVRTWDVATGKELRTLRGHAAAVVNLSFSPNGKILTSQGTDQKTIHWDVNSGKQIKK
jgi:WD40 repeat protein